MRSRLGRTLAAALALALLSPPVNALGVNRSFWGLNLAFYKTVPTGPLARLDALHVHSMRFTITWRGVQPRQGMTNWSEPDALVGQLASHGIVGIPVLFGSPAWATGRVDPITGAPLDGQTPSTPPVDSPAARSAWRSFLRAVVGRYGPDGSYWHGPYQLAYPGAAPLPIKAWQVWNEPNIPNFFAPKPSVRRYASLVKISRPAIASVDPNARVVLAGMPGHVDFKGPQFLRRLYRIPGFKGSFDVAAAHLYGKTVGDIRDEMDATRGVMRRAGDTGKPIWVTETSWGSAPGNESLNRGLHGQAKLLSRTLRMLRRHRHDWNLRYVSWFDLQDPVRGPSACEWCEYAGLFEPTGQPKPAWWHFERVVRGR